MCSEEKEKQTPKTISDVLRTGVFRLFYILRHLPGLLFDTVRTFHRNRGNHLAASISFFTILSLIPILLLVSSVLGFLLENPDVQKQVLEIMQKIIPTWKEESQRSVDFLQQNQNTLGIVGIIAMYITSRSLVASMNFSFDLILEEEKQKSFFRSHLDTLIVLVSLFLLVILSALVNLGYEFATEFTLISNIESYFQYYTPGVARVYGFVVSLFVYGLFFRVLPSRRLSFTSIFIASILSALLWETGKTLFSKYLVHVIDRYRVIYGGVSSMIFAILWAYLYGLSLVFGICFAGAEEERFFPPEETRESDEEQESS